MNSKSLNFFLLIVGGAPLYLLSILFPKRKGLRIIGASLGRHFSDNPKYYYLLNYSKPISDNTENLVWISRNNKVIVDLKAKGLPAEYLYSIRGILTVLRAETAIISHQLKDIHGPLMGGAKIIQLWHGMALRKIGYGGDWKDDTIQGKVRKYMAKWLPYTYYITCDKLLAPCFKAKECYIEPFSMSFRDGRVAPNIFLSRQPRTLCFENDFALQKAFFPEIDLLESLDLKFGKIISWLPTQRLQLGKTIIDVITDSHLDLEELNKFCEKHNYLFVIKAHFLDFELALGLTVNLDHILVYPHADPYPLLRFSDVLISDYSSVFFDFLLINRPILFMCYDLEVYRRDVQFYYEYELLGIGPICRKWEMIYEALMDLEGGTDPFANSRLETLNSFNFVTDKKFNLP